MSLNENRGQSTFLQVLARWLVVDGSDDLVGGFGQLGEAVGQAGAGQDEGVGVGVFGLAEFD
jgi:hypothetical protein